MIGARTHPPPTRKRTRKALVRDGHTQRVRAIVENVGRVGDAGGHGPAERVKIGQKVKGARLAGSESQTGVCLGMSDCNRRKIGRRKMQEGR